MRLLIIERVVDSPDTETGNIATCHREMEGAGRDADGEIRSTEQRREQ